MHATEPTYRLILEALKASPGEFLSGNLLAARVGLTRTAVWKHIQTLRSLGYDIESHPRRGYRLASPPDLLVPEEILPNLRTSWLARAYHHHMQTTSTNDEAFTQAVKEAPHGTVIVAEEQTQGRGRLRRPWLSSSHRGIYMSILLRTPLPIREAPQSTLVAALALAKVLRDRYRLPAAIKWPNDVLIAGKKVCGILTEMQSDQEYTRFIIIGIGINVSHAAAELNAPFRYPATSIALETGKPMQRQVVLLDYLHQLEADYDRFLHAGFASLLPELEAVSATIGNTIAVQCGTTECKGKALGFTPEGALRLLTESGQEEIVWVGDVTLVKSGSKD